MRDLMIIEIAGVLPCGMRQRQSAARLLQPRERVHLQEEQAEGHDHLIAVVFTLVDDRVPFRVMKTPNELEILQLVLAVGGHEIEERNGALADEIIAQIPGGEQKSYGVGGQALLAVQATTRAP